MKLAVVGATGLVGEKILEVLQDRHFAYDELIPVASEKSLGKTVRCNGKDYQVVSAQQAIDKRPHVAIFSAGSQTSEKLAPQFVEAGCFVIDNSSQWRMTHPLIVPEINGNTLSKQDKLIANPNCATIQMVMVLAPLHELYGLKRIVVSTYQSVTGAGKAAVDHLMDERTGKVPAKPYFKYAIDLNVIPQIDQPLEDGYTKEEKKLINETRKILNDASIQVSPTCVRVPAIGGHSESVNVEFHKPYDYQQIIETLKNTPGVIIQDDMANFVYPMPCVSKNRDEVFVGRIRHDESQPNTLNMWIVSDNLRKGAATNAVQIAEYLVQNNLL